MYKFYRKVDKSEENEFGLEVVEEVNPFEQPTFLSLLALNTKLRDTNGSISRILEFAGVRTPNGEELFPLSETPINFLGLAYSEVKDGRFSKIAAGDNLVKEDEDTREFVREYMLPLISENGEKKDIDECRRNMRNINILCFCDALFMVKSMNQILVEEMHNMNFTDEEIDDILSQVFIIPVGTEYSTMQCLLPDLKFTTLFVLDIADSFGITDEEARKRVFGDRKEGLFRTPSALDMPEEKICKNSRLLIANDNGDHSLTSFIHKGRALPAIIIKTVNEILNNSITNSNSDSFVPLDTIIEENLEETCKALIEERDKDSKEDLLAEILESVSYPKKRDLSLNSETKI